ncbi:MAG: hypothetical protein ACI4EG_10845 [Fusicatenibacter sp.]|nr:hypothetical protein [Fusicatenibacter sp.]
METSVENRSQFKVADLPDACQAKIREFERELNKQGYWNIALVAYQKEGTCDTEKS